MKPPPFDYCCPETLEEALALLAEHGEAAKVIAGGQSLVPMLNLRALHPDVLIDINRLPRPRLCDSGGWAAQDRRARPSQGGAGGGCRPRGVALDGCGLSLCLPRSDPQSRYAVRQPLPQRPGVGDAGGGGRERRGDGVAERRRHAHRQGQGLFHRYAFHGGRGERATRRGPRAAGAGRPGRGLSRGEPAQGRLRLRGRGRDGRACGRCLHWRADRLRRRGRRAAPGACCRGCARTARDRATMPSARPRPRRRTASTPAKIFTRTRTIGAIWCAASPGARLPTPPPAATEGRWR